MKQNKANTQLGVTFNVVEFEDSDILSLISDPVKLTRITDCVNADRRQKIALVDARYDLSEKISTSYGFTRKTKNVVADGVTTTVPDETEGAHPEVGVGRCCDHHHERESSRVGHEVHHGLHEQQGHRHRPDCLWRLPAGRWSPRYGRTEAGCARVECEKPGQGHHRGSPSGEREDSGRIRLIVVSTSGHWQQCLP